MAAILQYDAYARPNEVLAVTEENVLKPTPKAGLAYARKWGLCIAPSSLGARTKVGEQDDSIVLGMAGRTWLPTVLQQYLKNISPGMPLFTNLDLKSYNQHIAK
eukprot:1776472-Karenia_brevis.AAC.1